jgi:hypothetical protein
MVNQAVAGLPANSLSSETVGKKCIGKCLNQDF